MNIAPNVNGVHEVRIQSVYHCVEHKYGRPIDERRNWLHSLELGSLLIERHRHVEQNVEEHCHWHEHRVNVQIRFADFCLVPAMKIT